MPESKIVEYWDSATSSTAREQSRKLIDDLIARKADFNKLSRLFNEWPIELFDNLNQDKEFAKLITDVCDVAARKNWDPDEVMMNFATIFDEEDVLPLRLQAGSLITNIALQALRNFCDADGKIKPELRNLFGFNKMQDDEHYKDITDEMFLARLVEGYVGVIGNPRKENLGEPSEDDIVWKLGFTALNREFQYYVDGQPSLLVQQLPHLIELIKLEKQLELRESSDPIYKSGQELSKQCQKEYHQLLQEEIRLAEKQRHLSSDQQKNGNKLEKNAEKQNENKKKLEGLKEVVVSAVDVLKKPNDPKPLENFDRAIQANVSFTDKKQKMKIKCYEFAASVCGAFGRKEKQAEYISKSRQNLISQAQMFSDTQKVKPGVIKPAVKIAPDVEQSPGEEVTLTRPRR